MNLPDPLHPALVHFPIVLILLGAVLAVLAVPLRRLWLTRSVALVLALAAAGSLAAAWSGEEDEDVAEHAGGEAERIFEEHEEWGERTRNAAILAALAAGCAAVMFSRMPRAGRGMAALTAAIALAASWCVVEAGHYGGMLVYQHGVGMKSPGEVPNPGKPSRHDDDD
jgi:uncharacterized membrane protein